MVSRGTQEMAILIILKTTVDCCVDEKGSCLYAGVSGGVGMGFNGGGPRKFSLAYWEKVPHRAGKTRIDLQICRLELVLTDSCDKVVMVPPFGVGRGSWTVVVTVRRGSVMFSG